MKLLSANTECFKHFRKAYTSLLFPPSPRKTRRKLPKTFSMGILERFVHMQVVYIS